MQKCRVINIRGKVRDTDVVYIGRPGKWGNPFLVGRDGNHTEVVAKYKIWIPKQKKLMACLSELRGKALGCWCKPQPCHGDVLAELVNGLGPKNGQ